MARWRNEPVPKSATVGNAVDRTSGAAEQDQAAGGRRNRHRLRADGRLATASIVLKSEGHRRRLYAYLRWSELGKNEVLYVGEVNEPTDDRAINLTKAWRIAHNKNMAGPSHSLPARVQSGEKEL